MSLFSNFPQGGKKAGVQSISDGGTGATTAEAALANLGGFPKADGEALKTRIQPINLGGTGASEANQARQNLGAAAVKEMTKAEYDALAAIDPTIFYALTDVEADGVKIEVGSYVGTGTYGASNPNNLTFGFEPKVVIVHANKVNDFAQYCLIWVYGNKYATNSQHASTSSLTKETYVACSLSEKALSWHTTATSATCQLNESGKTYNYVAIG